MFCFKCGKELEEGTIYCPECGSKQIEEPSSNQNITEWYYIKDNTRQGPFNISYIFSEINIGNITRDTLVWKNGMQNWLSADKTQLAQYFKSVVPSTPDSALDDRFVWALATVPILVSWFIEAIFGISTLTTIVAIILNVVFISLDISALKKAGKNTKGWLWLGIVLVPLYLFMRASKTDKKYSYGLTWCVMFIIDLFL